MAAMSRLLPLVAYSSFAVFLLALLAAPTNALATEQHAHVVRGHDSLAKRKRNPVKHAKRCRPKPASLPAPAQSSDAPASATSSSSHAPSSSTSSSPPAQNTPAAPSTGGGLAGLDPNKKLIWAWPNGKWDLSSKWAGKRVGGMYTWSPGCPENCDELGISCWPMLWGFNQKAQFAKVDGSKYDFCFGQNEPNQVGQSNMSPQDGAKLWIELLEPRRAQGCRLVSPATTSAPSGKQWMIDWFKACKGQCNPEIIALHWYDIGIDDFKKYVTDFHKTFGKPIMITEYACQNFNGGAQCSKDETWNLHQTMAKWFDQQDWIVGYAPFGAMHDMQGVNPHNQLMGPDGNPNDLGHWYIHR